VILFDTTKTSAQRHHSGLTRVSSRLLESLEAQGVATRQVSFPDDPALHTAAGDGPRRKTPAPPAHGKDWFVTPELFSEAERPGFTQWLRARPCHAAAIFHDAIPLKFPDITWPQSVSRHPEYMKMLALFDRVFAVSAASRRELLGYWKWLGLRRTPPVEQITLGADFDGSPRPTEPGAPSSPPLLLCVGILEPRKNQGFLLEVCSRLWGQGLKFELHLVGRVNPHFGAPLLRQARRLARRHSGLKVHEAIDDKTLAALYARASVTLLPTRAEGCGLPLLESLWRGVPCICSDLPVLLENSTGGGCLAFAESDHDTWTRGLSGFIRKPAVRNLLSAEALDRELPTWSACATQIAEALG